MEKIVSQLDLDGFYIGPIVADESPLEPGVFLIPGGAIDASPPEQKPGKAFRLDSKGTGWTEIEDRRRDVLYLTSDGSSYKFGQQHGDNGSYAGLGPLPGWLTEAARPDAWSIWKGGRWVRDDAAWRASVAAGNQAKKAEMSAAASVHIATLQDAVDLQIATSAEAAALKLWRIYRVELSRVDVTQESPTWPVEPAA